MFLLTLFGQQPVEIRSSPEKAINPSLSGASRLPWPVVQLNAGWSYPMRKNHSDKKCM